ncbi:MAG: 3-phenylpropionate/cinnamic acid dioxygenase subunit beta [Pseudomonadota bacterium]
MSAVHASQPDTPAAEAAAILPAISAFLFEEARLMDSGRMTEWVALLTEDIHYFMPAQPAIYRRNLTGVNNERKMAFYDDDLVMIQRRVARMIHPTAWSEDPGTRMVHQISNIEVQPTGTAGEWRVFSVAVVFRSRNEADNDTLWARREDILRSSDGSFRLAKRVVTLAHNLLTNKNLNVFI